MDKRIPKEIFFMNPFLSVGSNKKIIYEELNYVFGYQILK